MGEAGWGTAHPAAAGWYLMQMGDRKAEHIQTMLYCWILKGGRLRVKNKADFGVHFHKGS